MRYLDPRLIEALRRRSASAESAVDVRFNSSSRPAPPADVAELEAAERRLGFSLPQGLREVYTEVGNGGFGPGYGLLGVGSGATDDLGNTADSLYALFSQADPDDPEWSWRPGVVPFAYWGCAVYSCITQSGTVIAFDEGSWVEDEEPLESWLSRWLDGSLEQPVANTP
jgi:hypothetical protein